MNEPKESPPQPRGSVAVKGGVGHIFDEIAGAADTKRLIEQITATADTRHIFDEIAGAADTKRLIGQITATADLNRLVEQITWNTEFDEVLEAGELPDFDDAFAEAEEILREAAGRELTDEEHEGLLAALVSAVAVRRLTTILVVAVVAHVSGAANVAYVMLGVVNGLVIKYPVMGGLLGMWGAADLLSRLISWIKEENGG
jgi:hypothetical protein